LLILFALDCTAALVHANFPLFYTLNTHRATASVAVAFWTITHTVHSVAYTQSLERHANLSRHNHRHRTHEVRD